jgi:hypothetical protein
MIPAIPHIDISKPASGRRQLQRQTRPADLLNDTENGPAVQSGAAVVR